MTESEDPQEMSSEEWRRESWRLEQKSLNEWKRFQVDEERRRDYYNRLGNLTQTYASWAAGANSLGGVYGALIIRALVQFNGAVVLGVPAVVLSRADALDENQVPIFVTAVVVHFVAFVLGGLCAERAQRGCRLLVDHGNAQHNREAHQAISLLSFKDDDEREKWESEKEQYRKSEEAIEAAQNSSVRMSIRFGWASAFAMFLGVAVLILSLTAPGYCASIVEVFTGGDIASGHVVPS